MTGKIYNRLAAHLKQNLWLYLFIFLVLAVGIATGAMSVRALGPDQQKDLLTYLNSSLLGINKDNVNSALLARDAIYGNLEVLFQVWFLGLTVIGLPLILAIVFFRGFVLGFTVGFLVQQKLLQGVLLALLSVLPQNLLNIPALAVAGVSAISFSLCLIRGRHFGRAMRLPQLFLAYSILIAGIGLVSVMAGLVEAYMSPLGVRLVTAYF
ncbi:MAG: stage II sporulation protein M [Bacillota bacterium]